MNKKILTVAAQLFVLAIFVACSSSDDIVDNNPQKSTGKKTYNLIVMASKGSDKTTRALSVDESTLNATWIAGEEVTVYKGETLLGTLTAQSNGTNTTLKGTLTGDIAVNDALTLKFLSPDYSGQDGTLDYIATHCDYAIATVEVTSVTDVSVSATTADFQNQQAIVKFTLKNSDGSATISASSLKVSVGEYSFTFTPAIGTSEFYLAVPDVSNKVVALVATEGGNTYNYAKTGVSFEDGSYYSITVKMPECISLTSVTSAHRGKIIGADGKVYSHALCATAAGTIASAMIGYVGNKNDKWGSSQYSSKYNHGLAISLTDVTREGNEGSDHMNSASAKSAAPSFKRDCPSESSGWFLASKNQWNYVIGLKSGFSAVGGSNLLNSSYWSSTEGESDSRNTMAFGFASNNWIESGTTTNAYVRSFFAF